MFSMLTKQDKTYINDLLDRRFEELAIMIQNGFAEIIGRVNVLESGVEKLEESVYELKTQVNTIEFKLINAPSNRLDKIEDDIRQIKSKFGLI